jgi:hypothetical protein
MRVVVETLVGIVLLTAAVVGVGYIVKVKHGHDRVSVEHR